MYVAPYRENNVSILPESPRLWTIALLLVMAGCLAYVNTLPGDWVWDDASSVLLHKHVQAPSQFFQLFLEDQHAFGRGQGNFYRPLVAASFLVDYQIAGGPAPQSEGPVTIPDISPFVFHVTNIAWHVAAALCLLGLLSCLGAPFFVLLTVPLLFVVHPLHTEAVAYISGRADMMSATGIFAALWCAILFIKSDRRYFLLVLSCLCFTAALLSKESSLIYPVLLGLLLPVAWESSPADSPEMTRQNRFIRFLPLLVSVCILAVYMALRATALKFSDAGAVAAAPLSQRLFETVQSFGIYMKLLFWPTGLHMERSLDGVSSGYALLGSVLLVALLLGVVFAWMKKNRRVAAGFAWFLASWLPISGIFPLNAPLAEHWMYVPMAGFWWALMEIAAVVFGSSRARSMAYVVVFGLCLFLGGLTVQRNLDWRDNETLFRETLRLNPQSARVHYNLAVTYEDILGNDAGARRHYEVFLHLRAQERAEDPARQQLILDDEIDARMSLGKVLMRLSEYGEAVNILAPLVKLSEVDAWKPVAAMAALRTGQSLLALGEIAQANGYFQQAMAIEPQLAAEIESALAGTPFNEQY